MRRAEAEYLHKVAQVGCIVCLGRGIEGSWPEIHHIRRGMGMGQRNDNYHVLPLCHPHHRTGGHGVALHAGIKAWEANHGTEMDLYHKLLGHLGVDDAQAGQG